jgi:hypothetical protein
VNPEPQIVGTRKFQPGSFGHLLPRSVGLMMSHGAEAVRLCIHLGTLKRAVEYLAGIGRPGGGADLRGVLGPVAQIVDRVCLDVDAGEAVLAKIVLECYFDGNRQPRTELRWESHTLLTTRNVDRLKR